MKRRLFIFAATLFCMPFSLFSQETGQIPPEVTAETAPAGVGETELFEMPVLPPLFGDMDAGVPAYGEQLPEFDRENVEVLRRKLLDEMPRYPTLRLWDNQYLYPFIYSSRSRFSGLDQAGLGTTFQITDWLSADVTAYLSGAYFGEYYPKSYINASLSSTLRIKLHDRIYLLGMGEVSAREGLNPKIAPGMGGKNSLGAGVEIFITEKFGITFSRQWEYYRGGWTGHNNFGPVMRQGRPR